VVTADFRGDWCAVYKEVFESGGSRNTSRPRSYAQALRGKTITATWLAEDLHNPSCGRALTGRWKPCPGNGTAPHLPPIHSVITHSIEGLQIDLLKIAAERWGFNYTIYRSPDRGRLKIDEWLGLYGHTYDILLGPWMDLLERRRMGFAWPSPIMYPPDARLVVATTQTTPSVWDTFTGFADPFTAQLWGTIAGCTIATGSLIWLVEASEVLREHGVDPELKLEQGYKSLLKAWYLAAWRFTGAGGFTPASSFGRVMTLSWSFAVLILCSSCTKPSRTLSLLARDRAMRLQTRPILRRISSSRAPSSLI
jgi:hypothetical protein